MVTSIKTDMIIREKETRCKRCKNQDRESKGKKDETWRG